MNGKQNICALSGHPQYKSQLIISRFDVCRVSAQSNSRDCDMTCLAMQKQDPKFLLL